MVPHSWSGKYWGCLRKRGGSRKSWLLATKVAVEVTVSRGQTHARLTTGYSAEAARAAGRRTTRVPPMLKHLVGSTPASPTPLTPGCSVGRWQGKLLGAARAERGSAGHPDLGSFI